MISNKKNNLGFTLIEMVIYIGILGLVISGFVTYSLSVSGVRNKNYSASNLQANGRSALEIMTRKIHEAEDILTPQFGVSSSELVLDMPNAEPNITFSLSGGVLSLTETGLPILAITDSRTSVSSLNFTNLSLQGDRSNVQIQMTIDYNVTESDIEFGYSKLYRTAVTQRL